MAGRDTLLDRVREARELAYAPFSDFPVGAGLGGEDGSIHMGRNVENAFHLLGVCAECNAVAAPVVAGGRRFRTLALSVSGSDPKPPCGGCCQVLAEFAPDLRVISEGVSGSRVEWSLGDLLPEPFLSQGREQP
jgi:cytidine deaminase